MLRNPAKYFIRKDVQEILIGLTGCDLNKIFKARFNPKSRQSQIELLTDEQLQQENAKTLQKAVRLLQMPPFLAPRVKTETILATDEKLSPLNLTNTNMVFTDISLNVPNKNRNVVVREPTGVLRKAVHSEREKLLQVYFPQADKATHTPSLFAAANLEECLARGHYLILLNKACARFEPNDPEFLRITHRAYEHISESRQFDALASTRFYGPLLFYLVWFRKCDNLIAHLLDSSRLQDCVQVATLYGIVNHVQAKQVFESDFELVQVNGGTVAGILVPFNVN